MQAMYASILPLMAGMPVASPRILYRRTSSSCLWEILFSLRHCSIMPSLVSRNPWMESVINDARVDRQRRTAATASPAGVAGKSALPECDRRFTPKMSITPAQRTLQMSLKRTVRLPLVCNAKKSFGQVMESSWMREHVQTAPTPLQYKIYPERMQRTVIIMLVMTEKKLCTLW